MVGLIGARGFHQVPGRFLIRWRSVLNFSLQNYSALVCRSVAFCTRVVPRLTKICVIIRGNSNGS